MESSSARCIYNSRDSRIRYTLIPYTDDWDLGGYEHYIHGKIVFLSDTGWDIYDTKKDAPLIIKPILENLDKSMDEFMRPDRWLIVKGEPSCVQNVIGEMLMDHGYMIHAYDIWKIKVDTKKYNVAIATDVESS